MKEYFSDVLLSTGAGSWGAYAFFKSLSDFCRDLLPITGVISFVIYILLNWNKIKIALRSLTLKNKKHVSSDTTKKDSNS